MPDFVNRGSIVRAIWANSDTVLLIFAGSAAEFALNRAVDWLFFTGRLPSDPIGRLFSTVRYAQDIVFSDYDKAIRTVSRMAAIHGGVEKQRGYSIPDWAYRDVLYMLIDYSERAYELMVRPLTGEEREELFDVFRRVGEGMNVPGLPANYTEWQSDRQRHLELDLAHSEYTHKLFKRYREELTRQLALPSAGAGAGSTGARAGAPPAEDDTHAGIYLRCPYVSPAQLPQAQTPHPASTATGPLPGRHPSV